MAVQKGMIIVTCLITVFTWCVTSEDTSSAAASDLSNLDVPLPLLEAEKRQHNIMRFGKRPSGHNFVHFGKRGDVVTNNRPHSHMFFGKRSETNNNIPELLQYLQRSQESSWKRGHNIMRFGKRRDNHNFIRFGKRQMYPEDRFQLEDEEQGRDDNYNWEDEADNDKRGGHSMMYFGKRGGHSMMYFGKRGGHSMMYFGKRQPYDDGSLMEVDDAVPDGMSEDKRAHSMIHFGKRYDTSDDGSFDGNEEKRAHAMIHFGKRLDEGVETLSDFSDEPQAPEDIGESDKRAHAMIHFGKRENDDGKDNDSSDILDAEGKRAAHSMIHFGKREDTDDSEGDASGWNHISGPLGSYPKRYHNLIRFGKRGGSHSMIHFGKRATEEKRPHNMIHFGKRAAEEKKSPHNMIHFGKRSIDENFRYTPESEASNSLSQASSYDVASPQSDGKSKINYTDSRTDQTTITNDKAKAGTVGEFQAVGRRKREVGLTGTPLITFVPYTPEFEMMDDLRLPHQQEQGMFEGFETAYGIPENLINSLDLPREEIPIFLSRQTRSDNIQNYGNILRKYPQPYKKESSKNVFLRFGKR